MSYEDMPTREECEQENREHRLEALQAAIDLINNELVPAVHWNETDARDMASENIDGDQNDVDMGIQLASDDVQYFLDNVIGIAQQAEDLL